LDPAVFAVTTRSRLRGLRYFPFMLVASLRIRGQLARTPGCVRWASIVAGPREFWTITVWESRDKMLDFMRSGAHEDIMWLFGKWLRSFWLMRWRLTGEERGTWDGLRIGMSGDRPFQPRATTPEARAALAAALDALPYLKAAAADDGAPTYDTSPMARRQRQLVSGGAAVVLRLEVSRLWRAPQGWLQLRRLNRDLREHPDVLRWVVGVSLPHEFYALAVLRNDEACSAFLARPEHAALTERWGDDYWVMSWQPANEFGHWDGLRLRRQRLKSSIPVPDQAARAAQD